MISQIERRRIGFSYRKGRLRITRQFTGGKERDRNPRPVEPALSKRERAQGDAEIKLLDIRIPLYPVPRPNPDARIGRSTHRI